MKNSTALMGRIVTVYAETYRYTDAEGNVSYPSGSKGLRAGWVTGVRHVRTGKIRDGYEDHDGEYMPAYLDVTGTVEVLLVTYWPTMAPVMARPEDVKEGGMPVSPQRRAMDMFKSKFPKEYEKYRASLREDVRNQKRGPTGRFEKGIPCQQNRS